MTKTAKARGARRRPEQDGPLRVIAYVRVSTSEQTQSGLGLAAQRKAVRSAVTERGWRLIDVIEDQGVSGSSLDRPGLAAAIARIEFGDADAILVSKLDRLSRSLLDFAGLMERSRRAGWAVIALDLGVDTTTPSGEMAANLLATFAQFERRMISQRTTDALAEKKAQGVRLGRPRLIPDDVVERILRERKAGRTHAQIAAALTADGIPTAKGGPTWSRASVQTVLGYAERKPLTPR